MRDPIKQQGFTLYMVLILMAIIAILVMAGGQMLNTEMRISSNDADRKFAFGLAEDTLKAGEGHALMNVHRAIVLQQADIRAAINSGSTDLAPYFAILNGNTFSENCTNGLCLPAIERRAPTPTTLNSQNSYATIPAWERTVDGQNVIDANGIAYANNLQGIQNPPRYIIEFLGPANDASTTLYRVTARAWGRNPNTQVTLQSVIRVENN